MRVSVNQPSLAKALGITGRAVPSRTTMPVLSNILLEAKDGQLRLAATNREIGINCWIGAKVEDEGAITIPARLLAEFINSLPPERIDMELSERTQTLHLSCARFEANIKGIAADDFPMLPTLDTLSARPDDAPPEWMPGIQAAFGASALRKMIDQVTFAASTDEKRPTLTGVEVTLQPEMVQMAATDGYRLSVRTLPSEGGPEKTVVIVPARSLGEVARISADADESQPVQCLVTPNRNQVLFSATGKYSEENNKEWQRVELVSELIDARFPDYRATIPKTYTTRTVVDTAALLKAVRVALLFARDNANIVRLHIGGDQLRLTGTSVEMGDNVGDIAAEVEGAAMEIAFNGRYLTDVLSQIDEPRVALETTQPTRPGVWMPVGNDSLLHVSMPMHSQPKG